jgi:hypothetical protein
MNERIRELLEQSGYDARYCSEYFHPEKFAELIVRECADFLKDNLDDHFAAEQLEEHFEVK